MSNSVLRRLWPSTLRLEHLSWCLLGLNGFRMGPTLCRQCNPHSGACLSSSEPVEYGRLTCRVWCRGENPRESPLIQRARLPHGGWTSVNTFTPCPVISYWPDCVGLIFSPDSVKHQCVPHAEGNSSLACSLVTKQSNWETSHRTSCAPQTGGKIWLNSTVPVKPILLLLKFN